MLTAVSFGGSAGAGGSVTGSGEGNAAGGGTGGTGGNVQITTSRAASYTAFGFHSPGILAQSIGGNGGNGGSADVLVNADGGNGGAAGAGGDVTIFLASHAISTTNDQSPGIIAVSRGGNGGNGGSAASSNSDSGLGGNGGAAGTIKIFNNASIFTDGAASYGILAQTFAGRGGNAGSAGGVLATAADGGSSGAPGAVTVANFGSINTRGAQSMGILALSVGGGGGVGGDATGAFAVGGDGGRAANGGMVEIVSAGIVTTFGDLAHGSVAMSIGGGGGTGGNATSYSAVVGVSIGGTAGDGGAGGSVTLSSPGLGATPGYAPGITTYNSNAAGLVGLSVGGGGGTGGAGYTITGSVGFGASVSVGGSGGAGGNGGAVTVGLSNLSVVTGLATTFAIDPATLPDDSTTRPLPVDSYGIVALSVGGGGGIGGSASAKTYVADAPIPSTGVSIALSASYSQGGDGGVAGVGGPVTVNLDNNVGVLTYGNGSHGLVALSQGGGGGLGGDSSATSTAFGFKNITKAIGRPNFNIDISASVGGEGSAGGAGGAVNVTLAGTNGAASTLGGPKSVGIQTLGDYAYAVLASSIGGGGGNAGTGAGSTQNGTSSGTALKLAVNVGAKGGSGGAGGQVTVNSFDGTFVGTAGDSAYGIQASSIGGGGGNSTGSSYSLGLPSIATIAKVVGGGEFLGTAAKESNITIKVGTQGGTGGSGGKVVVNLQDSVVATTGEAAIAIMAQSIGDGGGVAGSAGSAASSDNPTVIQNLKAGKKFLNGVVDYLLDVKSAIEKAKGEGDAIYRSVMALFPSLNIALSFGADGGAGGSGGEVDVMLPGTIISTQGAYAHAIMAQSIGGGGGTGGSAVAGGSQGAGNLMKINFNVALGGNGGAGGDGGPVDFALGGTSGATTISTAGYAAYGLFGQSIGGGGGAVGSAQTNSNGYFTLGAAGTTASASGGNGGTITVSQTGSAMSRISTSGDVAHAMLLQSIGGGGGVAGQGFDLSADLIGLQYPLTTTIQVGSNGGYGNGGAVKFDANALPYLAIATTGASAYGILAQSIGGGGGLGFQNPGQQATGYVGGATTQPALGNEVSIRLRDGSAITTTGAGSHAIFAQSVGGGGGILGFASGASLISEASPTDGSGRFTNGNGGPVTVSTGNSTIATTGASAYGIFAQSVGAGGGYKMGGDAASWVAGTAGALGSVGYGGLVTVDQSGTLSATGQNAIGIFAQSIGQAGVGHATSAGVQITVNGAVQGGSGSQGWGIWVDSDYTTNTVTIAQGGSVGSVAGQAIISAGYGITNVVNSGTVNGSYNLVSNNTTPGTFTNQTSGVLVPSGTLTGSLVNAGLIQPSIVNAFAPVTVAGNFQQTASGVYAPLVDFNARRGVVLTITGNATLAGTVLPQIVSVLPNIVVPVMNVGGNVSGALTGGNSSLFGYSVGRNGNQMLVAATSAQFAPASFNLASSQAAVASGLQSIWDAGGSPALGPLFASLGNTADASPSAYAAQLRQLSPDATLAPGARGLAGAQSFANNAMSCPTFQGTTAMLVEGQCGWMRITGRTAQQTNGNGVSDYKYDTVTWQIGGQQEIAPGWFLGGSLAYQESWLSNSSRSNTGKGQSGYGAVVLKYQTGPFLFAASAFGGAGQFNTSRVLTLLGTTQIAKGSPDTSNLGLLLRAAYTFGQEDFYVRPNISLSAIRVGIGAYRENGAGLFDLSVDSAAQTTLMATPMLEIGGRVALANDMVLRPYVAAGFSLLSSNSWQQTARLTAAQPGTGSFTTSAPIAPVEGRIAAGVQLYTGQRVDLRLQYDGEFSSRATAHSGSFVASLAF